MQYGRLVTKPTMLWWADPRVYLLVLDDEGAHVGCQSGLRPRDTPLGLILFLVPTLLPIP